jgi:hypothetical protein
MCFALVSPLPNHLHQGLNTYRDYKHKKEASTAAAQLSGRSGELL